MEENEIEGDPPGARQPRSPTSYTDEDPNLGFITTVHDYRYDLDDVSGSDPIDIQIIPTERGYAVNVWFTDGAGNRDSVREHLTIERSTGLGDLFG